MDQQESQGQRPNTLGKLFWGLYKPYKFFVLFFFLCSSFVGLNGLVNAYLMKVIIDSIALGEGGDFSYKTVFWPAVLVVLNFEVNNLSWRGLNYVHLKISPRVKSNLIYQSLKDVHEQSMYFFQNTLSGAIASNITILADNVEEIAYTASPRIVRGIVHMVIALISVYFVDRLFSGALFIWALGFTGVSFLYRRKIKNLTDHWAKTQSQVVGSLVDSVANFLSVKLFSRSNFELSLLKNSVDLMNKKFHEKEKFFLKFNFLQGFSVSLLVSYIVFILIYLRTYNKVTIGDFAFILGILFFVTENVWDFTEQIDTLNKALGKCHQSLKALYKPREIQDSPKAKPLCVRGGNIKFQNVRFQYKRTPFLWQCHAIEILPGQKVGLVGYSGSGKSTFVNLLLRLYDVLDGQILIDDQNIQWVTQESLRRSIAIIPQDPILFHRSIKDNILYGNPNAGDREVVEAAKKANAHAFIQELPQGYQSLVGERGIRLSGGQRQRVSLARAILKNAPILICDEATSQLDSATETIIHKSFSSHMRDRTTIVIAHRLSTVLTMDRILVFDKGCIVEDGSHQELLALNGTYKKLWDAQVGDFLPTLEAIR